VATNVRREGELHNIEFIIYYLSPNNLRVLSQLIKNRLNKKCIQKIFLLFLREITTWPSLEYRENNNIEICLKEQSGGVDWVNCRNRFSLEKFVKMTTKICYLVE
jgi:hypothetical protein